MQLKRLICKPFNLGSLTFGLVASAIIWSVFLLLYLHMIKNSIAKGGWHIPQTEQELKATPNPEFSFEKRVRFFSFMNEIKHSNTIKHRMCVVFYEIEMLLI